MKIGVFTIIRYKGGFRVIIPPEVREIQGKSVMAIVGTPPFHLGRTLNMNIVSQMQRSCQKMSEELFPRDKWVSLSKSRIKELRNSKSITRRNTEDTRILLWMEQHRKCAACGRPIGINEMTLEHKLPKAMHGPNTIHNLSVTCFRCNNEKGNALPFGTDPRRSKVDQLRPIQRPSNSSATRINLRLQNLETWTSSTPTPPQTF